LAAVPLRKAKEKRDQTSTHCGKRQLFNQAAHTPEAVAQNLNDYQGDFRVLPANLTKIGGIEAEQDS